MEILKPLGKEVSKKVKSWKEIKSEALELRDFMADKKYQGYWKDAFAISHTQVSRSPKRFFVVNKTVKPLFGHWCIVNARILRKSIPVTFPEGCMSFMYREMKRVDRWQKIVVLYWIPVFDRFLVPRIKFFKNLPAFICQHEVQHAEGKNIYGIGE